MKFFQNTGLLSKRKAVRQLFIFLFFVLFAVFVWRLNQVQKTELVVRTGQTFEKAVVTNVLQDNLQADGSRVGEQRVRVRILSGTQKGKELDVTSSSGYLFGAACTPGLKVILMQSVAGETTIASVYTQDREWVIYLFAGLYLLSSAGGWGTGAERLPWPGVYLFLCNFCVPASDLPKIFPLLDRRFYLLSHHTGDHVPDRRAFQKNSRRYFRHPGRCYHCRSFRLDFQHGFRYYRIQRI